MRIPSIVLVTVHVDCGCSAEKDEYSINITGLCGQLDISSFGGVDDVSLIVACLKNHAELEKLPTASITTFVLRETGECASLCSPMRGAP